MHTRENTAVAPHSTACGATALPAQHKTSSAHRHPRPEHGAPADALLEQAAADFLRDKDQLRGYVRRHSGADTATTEDLLHQIAEKYMRRVQQEGPVETPSRYLITVAKSIVTDHFRATTRRAEVLASTSDDLEWYLDLESSAEDSVSASTEMRELWLKIRSLPPRMQTVLVMSYIEGLPTERIARNLGTSAGAVMQIRRRAVKRLRAMYDAQRCL
ncbi:RNA polymerase sigma factor [Streptomyces avermitilis]|uniref:RNA polymerase sigma factor n=1 Tax=Streptomyces avermitilis TaxID=33903 RepID=UPI00367C2677